MDERTGTAGGGSVDEEEGMRAPDELADEAKGGTSLSDDELDDVLGGVSINWELDW